MTAWPTAPLGELVVNLDSRRVPLNEGERDRRRGEGRYPYFGANGELDRLDEFIFDELILCVAEDGGSWGRNERCAYVVSEKCWVNNHAHVLAPTNGTHLRFLQHYLNYADLSSFVTGTTRGKLTRAALDRIPVPKPPSAEQKQIAAILEAAEALREKRRHAMGMLDDLVEATFDEVFDTNGQPPVTVSSNGGSRWPSVLLTKVARLATGHTPDRKKSQYWHGDIPWITLSDIRLLDGRVAQTTQECVSEIGIDNSSAVKLPSGTVCFSRTASVGFATLMGREMCTSQDFVNWVCGPEIDGIYLMNALIRARTNLRALSSGSTHKTIYFPTVEQFHVQVPPIQLQRKFAAAWSAIQELRENHSLQFEQACVLSSSLEHRAFRGDL